MDRVICFNRDRAGKCMAYSEYICSEHCQARIPTIEAKIKLIANLMPTCSDSSERIELENELDDAIEYQNAKKSGKYERWMSCYLGENSAVYSESGSEEIDEDENAEPVFVSRNKLLIDKQFRKSVPREKRAICEKKIEELVRALDEGTEHTFLHNNDGKPMKGAKNVYKFRATHADRIIYVHTEDIPHLKDRYPDSIVLLRYTDHDEQGSVAARVDLNSLRISEEKRNKAYQTDFRFTEETSQRDCDEYFSEMVSNVINISQLKSYISTSEENYDVLLNEEQYEVLNSGAFPLIIYGCAGSGKTVLSTHLIYGFIKSGYDSRALYTSLSENLNTHVQKLFANIAKADEPEAYRDYKADFLEVNALFRSLTGAHKSEFSDFIRFKELCRTNTEAANKLKRLAKDNIDIMAVWSEIRGIIKGHLDENWG